MFSINNYSELEYVKKKIIKDSRVQKLNCVNFSSNHVNISSVSHLNNYKHLEKLGENEGRDTVITEYLNLLDQHLTLEYKKALSSSLRTYRSRAAKLNNSNQVSSITVSKDVIDKVSSLLLAINLKSKSKSKITQGDVVNLALDVLIKKLNVKK